MSKMNCLKRQLLSLPYRIRVGSECYHQCLLQMPLINRRSFATHSKFTPSPSATLDALEDDVDDSSIPDFIPDFDELPDAPEYLSTEYSPSHNKLLSESDTLSSPHLIDDTIPSHSDSKSSIDGQPHSSDDPTLSPTDKRELTVIPHDSFDIMANSQQFPPVLKAQITPTLSDVPSQLMPHPESQLPMTADEAANWPVPPWKLPGWVEPVRKEVIKHTKYPELFDTSDAAQLEYKKRGGRPKKEDSDALVAQREKIRDLLKKRRDPKEIKKPSLIADEKWIRNLKIICVIAITFLYYQFRVKGKFENPYGYLTREEVIRDQRMARLPIKYRSDGELTNTQLLGGLETNTDGFINIGSSRKQKKEKPIKNSEVETETTSAVEPNVA